MSGPCFHGFVVEKWKPQAPAQIVKAIAAAAKRNDPWRGVPAEATDVFVHGHRGSAWVALADASGKLDASQYPDLSPLAQAIADSTGSPTWAYWYHDGAEFSAWAQRFRKGAPPEKVLEAGSPAAHRKLNAQVVKNLQWEPKLLAVASDIGPVITDLAEAQWFCLDKPSVQLKAKKKKMLAPSGSLVATARSAATWLASLEPLEEHLAQNSPEKIRAAMEPLLMDLRTMVQWLANAPLEDVKRPAGDPVDPLAREADRAFSRDEEEEDPWPGMTAELRFVQKMLTGQSLATLVEQAGAAAPESKRALGLAAALKLRREVTYACVTDLLELVSS
jgi:hypothetical protein